MVANFILNWFAPTGKAAARLTESIENALAQMPISDELRASIPKTAETLHRLLGVRPLPIA